MAREFHILEAVHPLFPPAPRPILLCEDPAVIGATFFLMERRNGLILREPVYDPVLIRNASSAFVNCLIQLHLIRAEGLGIGNPAGFLERQVRGWIDRWQRAQTEGISEIEAIVPWLHSNIPLSGAPTLIHNDYKLDNIALNLEDPSRVEAVFDWEMATVGDPLLDVGVALTYWCHSGMPDRDGVTQPPFTTGPGWLTREAILDRYADATERDVSRIRYYEVFGVFKLLVIIQQIYYRWLKGQTQDPRFAAFGAMVRYLAGKAAELAEKA
jgi:aminoglycoside phosphotransferase (APT) family kinase protein